MATAQVLPESDDMPAPEWFARNEPNAVAYFKDAFDHDRSYIPPDPPTDITFISCAWGVIDCHKAVLMKSASFKKDFEAYPHTTKLYSDECGTCCAAILCTLYTDKINDDCVCELLSFNLDLWPDGRSHQLPALCLLAEENLLRRELEIDGGMGIADGLGWICRKLENDLTAPEKRQLREAIIQRHAVTIVSTCAYDNQGSWTDEGTDSLADLCEEVPDLTVDLLKGLMEELGRPASKVVANIIQELVFGTQRQTVATVLGCAEDDVELRDYRNDSLTVLCEQWPDLGNDLLNGLMEKLGRPASKVVASIIEELVFGKGHWIKGEKTRDFD